MVTAVIIVDHGSRLGASNDMLVRAAELFAAQSEYSIVEPAHMELASPDIAAAFDRCVERGATRVIVFPYFLSPGRHWTQDIPGLVAKAAAGYPAVKWLVTAPFGLHPGMTAIINDRIRNCLIHSESADEGTESVTKPDMSCDLCDGITLRCPSNFSD